MSAPRGRRRRTGEHFAKIPTEVLTSPAFTSLPNYTVRLLLIAAAQYRGRNNGDIAVTYDIARNMGLASKKHLVRGLKLLLDRGLLVRTRVGGKRPLGPTLYALGWAAIDDLRNKFDPGVVATIYPPNAWASWKPFASSTGLPGDQRSAVHNKTTGLPGDRDGTPGRPQNAVNGTPGRPQNAVNGTPGRPQTPINGTPGSPPSRSRGGDTPCSELHGRQADASAGRLQ